MMKTLNIPHLLPFIALLLFTVCKKEKKPFDSGDPAFDHKTAEMVKRSTFFINGKSQADGSYNTTRNAKVFQTAFALQALAASPFEVRLTKDGPDLKKHSQQKALDYLTGLYSSPGWKYFAGLPVDMDDTANVLLALKLNGRDTTAYLPALYKLIEADGRIKTWPLAEKGQEEMTGSYFGHKDDDIMSVFYLALPDSLAVKTQLTRFTERLALAVKADGSIKSDWYFSRYYAPNRAARLLATCQREGSCSDQSDLLTRLAAFALASIQPDGRCSTDPRWQHASSALCAGILALADKDRYRSKIKAVIEQLAAAQKPDGSWGNEPFFNRYTFSYSKKVIPFDSEIYTIALVMELLNDYYQK